MTDRVVSTIRDVPAGSFSIDDFRAGILVDGSKWSMETRVIAALAKRLGGDVLLSLDELTDVTGLVIHDTGRVIAT